MFKKVTEDAILPTKDNEYSAYVDIYASHDVTIGAGETKLVGLGIAIDLDNLLENVPTVKDMKRWYKERSKANIIDVSEEDSLFYIKDEFLKSNYIQLMLNDSLATKGLILNNGIKIFNLDFTNELKMIIHNPICDFIDNMIENTVGCNSSYSYKIKKGDKIGQLILLEHKTILFGIESEDEYNNRFYTDEFKKE